MPEPTMRKQYMLFGLPSCGTDWLADTIAQVNELRYFREFFNPICNLAMQNYLTETGCELASTKRYICRPYCESRDAARFDAMYLNTWAQCEYEFTKENYLAFQASYFLRWFHPIVIYRRPDEVFPPRRVRVIAWYSAIWESLLENNGYQCRDVHQVVCQANAHCQTVEQRCVVAHQICYWKLLATLRPAGVKPISYAALVSSEYSELCARLSSALPACFKPHAVAEAIHASRNEERRSRSWACQAESQRYELPVQVSEALQQLPEFGELMHV